MSYRRLREITAPFATLALLLTAAAASGGGPQDALRDAVADVKRLPPEIAATTLYLDITGLSDDVAPEDALRAVAFWANSLSDRSALTPPRVVSANVLALDMLKYDRVGKRWPVVRERFAAVDPWWHTQFQFVDWGHKDAAGVWIHQRWEVKPQKGTAAGTPLLDYRQMQELVTLTGSAAPIVRCDWWAAKVCRPINTEQVDERIGYYEWLGIVDRKSFEKLCNFSEHDSIDGDYELRAALAKSGVAFGNRQIEIYQALWGKYARTLDSEKSTGRSNALQTAKKGDFQHKAEEHYGQGSNGLFRFLLCDQNGKRVNFAPAEIVGGDSTSTSNNPLIVAGLSCARCHLEGLRPVPDWIRRAGRLKTVDRKLYEDFTRQYASNLEAAIDEGNAKYAAALKRCNGLTPAENARLVGKFWHEYAERDWTVKDIARSAGRTPGWVRCAFRRYDAAAEIDPRLTPLPTVLAGFLHDPPEPARVEQVEEAFPFASLLLATYPP